MTNDEIRIAIAKERGYTRQEVDSVWWDDPSGSYQLHEEDLPDYPEDLNAMNEVELTMDEHTAQKYVVMLARVIAGTADKGGRANGIRISVPQNVLIRASARHRAEAYLRIKHKWKK